MLRIARTSRSHSSKGQPRSQMKTNCSACWFPFLKERPQISNPFVALSFVLIRSARSSGCTANMNASGLARFFRATAEIYCHILKDQPVHSCISPVNVSGSPL